MRSTVFVTVSILVHVVCVVALAMTPTGHISSDEKPEQIEVGLDTGTPSPEPTESAPAQAELPKVEAPKSVPEAVKEPKAPMPAKVIAAKKPAAPTSLPKKEVLPEPEKLDPVIAEEDMVETASATPPPTAAESLDEEVDKLEMIPVKETAPAGVEAAPDEATEASSEDLNETSDPTPAVTSVAAAAAVAAPGAGSVTARSYLDLKQAGGNQTPKYPLQARLQKREGKVDLLYKVTAQGKVSELKILKSSGFQDLDKAAMDAVAKYRFVAGQEGWARHPVVFSLKGPSETLPSKLRSVGAQTE